MPDDGFKISLSDGLAVAGLVLAILLAVLDKAEKLKSGPMLFLLLTLAFVMTLPLAIGNAWVVGAGSIVAKVTRSLLLIFMSATVFSSIAVWITPKSSESTLTHDGSAELTIEDIQADPFSGGKELKLAFNVKNSGAGDAIDVYSAYYLFVRSGLSGDAIESAKAMKDGMHHFSVQWPALRRAQKETRNVGTVPRRKTIPLFVIKHPISPKEREDIFGGRTFAVVFGAVRYRDGKGIHEVAICRYLQPPFDQVHWNRDERYENKTVDIIQAQIPIQVSYDPVVTTLPLHVPVGQNWVVSFTDKVAIEMLWSNGAAMTYPAGAMIPLHHEQPIGTLTITNHGTVPVLNLSTELQFEFRPGALVVTGDAARRVVESENLGYRSLPLAVDSLAPGQSARVFLVNESRYCLVIHPVLQGNIELQGEMNKMEVEFKQRTTTALDQMQDVKVKPVSKYIWRDNRIIGVRPTFR